MTHAQAHALTALLNAIDVAVTEEREFWNDQKQTPDNRSPDWLDGLEECFADAKKALGAKWVGKGYSIPTFPPATPSPRPWERRENRM